MPESVSGYAWSACQWRDGSRKRPSLRLVTVLRLNSEV